MSGTRDRGGGIDIGNYVNIENYVNEGYNIIERPHTPRTADRPKSATLVQSFLSASPYTSSVTPTNLFAVSPRLPEKPVQFVSGPPRAVLGRASAPCGRAFCEPPPCFHGTGPDHSHHIYCVQSYTPDTPRSVTIQVPAMQTYQYMSYQPTYEQYTTVPYVARLCACIYAISACHAAPRGTCDALSKFLETRASTAKCCSTHARFFLKHSDSDIRSDG